MISSLSDSTLKQYQSCFRRWTSFCRERNIDPLALDPILVVTFLQWVLDTSSVSYSTINTFRSALSLLSPNSLGCDPLISRFMKGVFHVRPPKPKYDTTWDPQLVLDHLDHPIEDFPGISHKLATLMLLATGQRLQTIALIRMSDIHQQPGVGVKIFISGRTKTTAPHRPQPCLELHFFPHRPHLCVVSLLQKYLNMSADLRPDDSDFLFIICRPPYTPASRQVISKWVSSTLNDAGVPQAFRPHSTRHASVSAANRSGMPIESIIRAAGWSRNSSTFAKFYNRPLTSPEGLLPHVFSSTNS